MLDSSVQLNISCRLPTATMVTTTTTPSGQPPVVAPSSSHATSNNEDDEDDYSSLPSLVLGHVVDDGDDVHDDSILFPLPPIVLFIDRAWLDSRALADLSPVNLSLRKFVSPSAAAQSLPKKFHGLDFVYEK